MTNTIARSKNFVGQLLGRSKFAVLPLAVTASILLSGLCLSAQAPAADATKPAEPTGFLTKYTIHQSLELGGRIVNVSGSNKMWDTLSNIQSGPRILGQSLQLHSIDPKKTPLFDSLSTASYGLGGDPNDSTFLRFSKGKLYEFSGNFRRDRNFFDYNLLVNPMIPQYIGTGSTANSFYVPVVDSLHSFNTTRRMTDTDLTILPLAKVSFRAGFSHSTNEGPSFTTQHNSLLSDIQLAQWWRNSADTYRLGVDIKIAPRTTLSYDQIFLLYKGDTTLSLARLNSKLSTGTPVTVGFELYPSLAGATTATSTGFLTTATAQSCGATSGGAVTYTGQAILPATCAFVSSVARNSPTRNVFPTEQVRFASSLIPHVTVNGRFFYRGTTVGAVNNYSELQQGFKASGTAAVVVSPGTSSSPYATRGYDYTGGLGANNRLATTKRIDAGGDLGATWQVTHRFSATDNFTTLNWRETGAATLVTNTAYGPNDNTVASQVSPVSFGTLGGTPYHLASIGADSSSSAYVTGFAQKSYQNTFLVAYEITPKAKLSVGYKYRNRAITGKGDYNEATNYYVTPSAKFSSAATVSTYVLPYYNSVPKGVTCIQNSTSTACTVSAPGTYATETHNFTEDWGLIGLALQPTSKLRVNINYDFESADGILTPVSDRRQQEIKVRGSYKPKNWLSFAFTGRDHEGNNSVAYVNHKEHSSDYSLGSNVVVNDKLSFDLNYAYDDVFASTGFCYMATGQLGAVGSANCYGDSTSTIYVAGTGYYDSPTHFGSVNVHFVPTKQVTTNFGYRIDQVDGVAEQLNKRQAPGSLNSRNQSPFADVTVAIAPQWSYKAAWNYTGYTELGAASLLNAQPGGSRTMHGNVLTLGVKYAF